MQPELVRPFNRDKCVLIDYYIPGLAKYELAYALHSIAELKPNSNVNEMVEEAKMLYEESGRILSDFEPLGSAYASIGLSALKEAQKL